jgi:hypothetical protein
MREVERPKDIPRSLIHEEVLNGTDDGEEGRQFNFLITFLR